VTLPRPIAPRLDAVASLVRDALLSG